MPLAREWITGTLMAVAFASGVLLLGGLAISAITQRNAFRDVFCKQKGPRP